MIALIIVEGALLWMIVVLVVGVLGGVYRNKDVVAPVMMLASLIVIYVTLIKYTPIIKDVSETL